jgi:AcrR family transcriptional regulator
MRKKPDLQEDAAFAGAPSRPPPRAADRRDGAAGSAAARTAVLRLARDEPQLGQAAIAERLAERGLTISPSGVRYILQKHGLETAVKRLRALAREDGGSERLSERQRRLLARGELAARLAHTAPSGGREAAGEAEPVERRRLILDAAAELFSEQGYDRTSIRDIARKVGLLPGSVYHHFASKDELYLSVHREGFRRVLARVREAAASGSDPWDSLRRACEVQVTAIAEGSPVDRITGHHLAMTDRHDLFAKIQPYRDEYENVFRALVEALPLAPGTDRTLLRLFLFGSMNWVSLWYRPGRRTPIEIADALVAMLRDGVAPVRQT